MEPRIQYTSASDGVSIAYATLGEGPPIVFPTRTWGDIHVFTAVEQFRPHIRSFAERGWRVIFYDGRGMGSSQRDATDMGLAGRVRDVGAVIEAVGADRVVLCGNQSGGPAAIAYAVRHPERVSRLVLVNTCASGEDYFAATPSLRVAKDLQHIAEDQWEFYTLALASAFMGFSDIETARRLAATIRAGVSPRSWIADRDAMQETDVSDMLSSVATPTLVVHDRADTIGDFSLQASKLASRIPNARFVATDGAVESINEFLREGDPRSEPRLPSGMSAILFADIVDSTALTERMGDATFRERARSLDASLRKIIVEAGGIAIDGKLLGDGVLATFISASQAIDAARACVRACDGTELQLHLGIHAGDVIREANNVYGGAVNIASRISGLSAPAEVLVSRTVRDLARTSAGVVFEDRGEHALKGVAEPVHVFAVRASGRT